MRVCSWTVLILVGLVCFCQATRRQNSRQMKWESDGSLGGEALQQEGDGALPRDGRKIIFINNVAYDLSEEEMEVYLREGHVPRIDKLKRKPAMDSLAAAMNLQAKDEIKKITEQLTQGNPTTEKPRKEAVTKKEKQELKVEQQKEEEKEEVVEKEEEEEVEVEKEEEEEEPAKSSRFVADPSKTHLIQKVDEEEMQKLRDSATTTTTPKPNERVVVTETSSAAETSTIRYEYTKVNALEFLWNELKNIGDLLGREMIGSVSGTLYYIWETLVRYLTNRAKRAIRDLSSEL